MGKGRKKSNLPIAAIPVELLPSDSTPVQPRELDGVIRQARDGALDVLQVWQQMRPLTLSFVEDFKGILDKQRVYLAENYTAHDHKSFVQEAAATMMALTNQLDKVSRAASNLTKVVTDLTRLQQLLTGEDKAEDLGDLSLNELARIVMNTAQTLKEKP